MRIKERVSTILKELNLLYPNPPIPLKHTDNFSLLIAVLLSAQSTDKKVNEITPQLFKLAKSPQEMHEIGEEAIYQSIKQIGLAKTKAKNIYKLSHIIMNKFSSIVPNNFRDLESLPGVGHKTASVVMSQGF